MIRSSKHYFSNINTEKLTVISNIISEYKVATQKYIDYIWSSSFEDGYGKTCFDISNDLLNLPKYLDYNSISFDTPLSARLLSSSLCQAIGIVNGVLAFRKKTLWVINKRKSEGFPTEYWEKRLVPISKPILNNNFQAELSSKNIDFQDGKSFDLFIRLSSSGFRKINIPINFHKQSNKWKSAGGKRLAGVLLSKNYIQLRWELPEINKKDNGISVGADTGFTSVITLSDGQSPPQTDNHGHSLKSICEELSRKKKGSKNFKQKEAQRLNFINWSINQLNFTNIKEVKLEEIKNIFYKKNTSRLMSHFTNSIIETKCIRLGEEIGVQFSLQPSIYKSQRCSGCSIVLKSNRKGKVYNCGNCKTILDADLNSAKNNELSLYKIPFGFNHLKLNVKGFFWKEDGFYDLNGEEIRVPHTDKNE